jgi:hypothetical protein
MVPVRQAGTEVTPTFWAKLAGHHRADWTVVTKPIETVPSSKNRMRLSAAPPKNLTREELEVETRKRIRELADWICGSHLLSLWSGSVRSLP